MDARMTVPTRQTLKQSSYCFLRSNENEVWRKIYKQSLWDVRVNWIVRYLCNARKTNLPVVVANGFVNGIWQVRVSEYIRGRSAVVHRPSAVIRRPSRPAVVRRPSVVVHPPLSVRRCPPPDASRLRPVARRRGACAHTNAPAGRRKRRNGPLDRDAVVVVSSPAIRRPATRGAPLGRHARTPVARKPLTTSATYAYR